MPEYKKVYLKKGKDFQLKNRHRWIFSGAIDKMDAHENGEILKVYSNTKEFLGHAYFNDKTDIAGRMLNFSDEDPLKSIKDNIKKALNMRTQLIDTNRTNCFRAINGENDGLPGLIVDIYNDVAVIQISTLGMDRLRPLIISELSSHLNKGVSIYERSSMGSRKIEGLNNVETHVLGPEKKDTEVLENGIKFIVDFIDGQKTGFFLDMREMRQLIGSLSKNKKVLNCFSYSGGFSLYALKHGANVVQSVEISEQANKIAEQNFDINGFKEHKKDILTMNVFDFIKKEQLDHDIIILDPPAFAKKRSDVKNALTKYYELNRTTLRKMKSGTLLLTCSCSYHVDQDSFDSTIKKAGVDANKELIIISKHRMAMDHSINIYHKEFDYLKSLLIYVR
jgi:23S rRNA (cytosine1962-C5)-methyltransferase